MTIVMLTIAFFALRYTFYKDKNFKVLIIFVVVYNVFIVVLNLNNVIKNQIELVYYLLTIVYGVTLSAINLVVTYFKDKKDGETKTITIKHKTIKYYRVASFVALIFDALLVIVMFIINPSFDGYKTAHIIILSLIFVWNILYNIYFLKNKVKGEAIIIVTNESYEMIEIEEKYSYKLNDYINNDRFVLNKTVVGLYKTYDNDNKYIRIFYVSKYKLNNPPLDKSMHKLLKDWSHPSIVLDIKKEEGNL